MGKRDKNKGNLLGEMTGCGERASIPKRNKLRMLRQVLYG